MDRVALGSQKRVITLGPFFSQSSLMPIWLSAIFLDWQITSADVFSEAWLPLVTKSVSSFFKAAVIDKLVSSVDSTEGGHLPKRPEERGPCPPVNVAIPYLFQTWQHYFPGLKIPSGNKST